ncbi:MAG: hypothetical protein ACK41V_23935, partial [Acidovorax sp.]|uniref:hypothetical protein n=1 Tax=Acidovorax sp. TaxID=1872122 RepID=UPI00391B68DC
APRSRAGIALARQGGVSQRSRTRCFPCTRAFVSPPRRRPHRPSARSPAIMVLSAVFVMDHKGKTIICRNYRGDIPQAAADR